MNARSTADALHLGALMDRLQADWSEGYAEGLVAAEDMADDNCAPR